MSPEEYCEQRAAARGSSLYYALLFLPPRQRQAIAALYAFCHEVVDGVLDVTEPTVAQAKLAWWRMELDRLGAGTPQHPVTRALAPHLAAYSMASDRLLPIIEGAALDLARTGDADHGTLQHYCDLVGGVPAELSAYILGAPSPAALQHARRFGQAVQWVTLMRDLGRHARRGRVYLPREDLQRFGVPSSDLPAARYAPSFAALMAFEAQRVRALFRDATASLSPMERRAQRPVLIMAALSYTLLDELERARFQVLHQRIDLPPLRKLWIAWRTWTRGDLPFRDSA